MKWVMRSGEVVEAIGLVSIREQEPHVAILEWYIKGRRRIEKHHLGASGIALCALPENIRNGDLIECEFRVANKK